MSDVVHPDYPDNRPVVHVEISESVFGGLERFEDVALPISGLGAVAALDNASEKMVQKQRLNSVSSLVSFHNTICGSTTPIDLPLRVGKKSRHYDLCLSHTGEPYCAPVKSVNGHDMSCHEDEGPEPRFIIVHFDFKPDKGNVLEGLSEQALRVLQRQPDRYHVLGAVILRRFWAISHGARYD